MLSSQLWPIDVAQEGDPPTCQLCARADRLPGLKWCDLCIATIRAWRRGLSQAEHFAMIREALQGKGEMDGREFLAEMIRRLQEWG